MLSYASLVACDKTVAKPINFREQEHESGKEAERFGAGVLRRSCRWWVILIHKVRRFSMQPGATRFTASSLNVNPQSASSQKIPGENQR